MPREFEPIIRQGHPLSLGCRKEGTRFNFAIYAQGATAVSLALFDETGEHRLAKVGLDPNSHRTGHVWHCAVEGLHPGMLYGYYIAGPYDPEKGELFSPQDLLCDPYATHISAPRHWGEEGPRLARIPGGEDFDWGQDRPLKTPWSRSVLYELHVRGFTRDPSSGATHPGTYAGLIEKIPYLKDLGVTAIELLPVYEFDERDHPKPSRQRPLYNYWGYSPLHFFAPMARFAHGDPTVEFRQMVKAMHAAGIEVLLDVVYNHTGEKHPPSAAFGLRGLAANRYYMIDRKGDWLDYTGCGNTLNTNHPACIQLILESLRYWVVEMHVDGFRFDLASVLTRGAQGEPLTHPPLIEAITQDPILADTKLIAEAWDPGGLYQVGHFPGGKRWHEWNGRYRDDIRQFIKGTDGYAGAFATRISGSQDLYNWCGSPLKSINFITAHDGFSLYDLVSYNQKHNLLNNEKNRDGTDANYSWNCGEEGKSEKSSVQRLRQRQMRNFHLALMLSRGVPMLTMGDEYAHTKQGNNNAYCHDTPLNWFQWNQLEEKASFWRFYRALIQLRVTHPGLLRNRFLTAQDIHWHGHHPLQANWEEESRFVAFTLVDHNGGRDLYAAFNASHRKANVTLPRRADKRRWHQLVDTAATPPRDWYEEDEAPMVTSSNIVMPPHSAVLLQAHA